MVSLDVLFWRVFRFFCSLKLAVVIMVSLTIALIVATTLESIYDTPTAKYWVYDSGWFHGILAMLGILILCVALSRYPWKRRHIPFLLAHLGILILLFGSWVTYQFGIDGSMRLTEEQSSSVLEINSPMLYLMEGNTVVSVPIRWVPPNGRFKPVSLPKHGIEVDQFLAHAEPVISFIPVEGGETEASDSFPAARVRIQGGPMRISQDFWLWAGDPQWSTLQAGPAELSILMEGMRQPTPTPGKPTFILKQGSGSELSYQAISAEGKRRTGRFPSTKAQGQVIHPGWKGDVRLTIEEWIPHAVVHSEYKPSSIQYGDQAPPSAIHIISTAGDSRQREGIWLGLGDRATLDLPGDLPGGGAEPHGARSIGLAFLYKRVILPFSMNLERFRIDFHPGTQDPAEYSSLVKVGQQDPVVISMNEPLEHGGFTFYQASYEPAEPRPVTSILSVNRDPGRAAKYFGSLLIVLGSILLFAAKSVRKKKVVRSEAPHAGSREVFVS